MTTYIALLRAVNVGGHGTVAMADLRALLTELGLENPRSLLQSGNIVFRSDARSAAALERLLESETEQRLDVRTHFLVRSASDWARVIAANPFVDEAKRDPARLHVVALKNAPKPDRVDALQDAITGREILRANASTLYIVYPDGAGRSRLTNALIERTLDTRGTARNWNTVLKLDALASAETARR